MAKAQRQIGFTFRTWGGARAGAGRPRKGKSAGVSHLRRPAHSFEHPLHITLRVGRGIPSLREHSVFLVVRRALAEGKQKFGFSLVHFSVQRDHLHLIAEARHRRALSRGVQGLSVRVARAVNAQLGRSGKLFADRYHARALTSPRTVKLALRYVLLNIRKHARGPQGRTGAPIRQRTPLDARGRSVLRTSLPAGFVDPCSSAAWFSGFDRPAELVFGAREAREDWQRTSGSREAPVMRAESWLLRIGWRRAHDFDVDETPGQAPG